MKIEAHDREVQEIFALGYFKVPRFQRPYSWGEDEVGSFWKDVIIDNKNNYFIGSMVVYQTKKPYLGIVDGQQRLTTITMLLAAIRNAFLKFGEDNLAHGIHKFIEYPNIDNENEFVLNAETSFPYFQGVIQSFKPVSLDLEPGTEETNLIFAFEFITKELDKVLSDGGYRSPYENDLFDEPRKRNIEKLKVFRDKVLSLKLVFIQLDNEDDAYLIFETLNARGRDLTTPDLVKNLLLNKVKSNNAQFDTAKVTWNKMVKSFDDAGTQNGMEPFLYHFWLSKHEYTTEKNIFNKIKEKSNTENQASDLLSELQENSQYYVSMVKPEIYTWMPSEKPLMESLKALNLFKVKQNAPMVLSLIRAYRTKKITIRQLKQVMLKIEHFHYIFNAVTSQRSSGSVSTHYSKYAILLSRATTNAEIQRILGEMEEGLRQRKPGYSEFKASFDELIYTSKIPKNKQLVKYTLTKLAGQAASGLSIDHSAMTIEHILPESSIVSETDSKIVGSIGNLILVDEKTNSEELGDLPFIQKKEKLEKKMYPFGEYVFSQEEWSAKQIKERAEQLSKISYNNVFAF